MLGGNIAICFNKKIQAEHNQLSGPWPGALQTARRPQLPDQKRAEGPAKTFPKCHGMRISLSMLGPCSLRQEGTTSRAKVLVVVHCASDEIRLLISPTHCRQHVCPHLLVCFSVGACRTNSALSLSKLSEHHTFIRTNALLLPK